MLILGIDPGYAIIGWGLIRFERGKYIPVDFGAITTNAGVPFNRRLEQIYDQLGELLDTHHPDVVAVEKLRRAAGTVPCILARSSTLKVTWALDWVRWLAATKVSTMILPMLSVEAEVFLERDVSQSV